MSEPTETLTVQDNRTGKSYQLPIHDGAIRATDLRNIKIDDADHGLMTYDPGLFNTAITSSRVTYLDGEAGILQYRGYPIEQLAETASYLEVAYLLIFGRLPSPVELEEWVHDISMHTYVHENIKSFMHGFRYDAHPMGMLLASVGALSTFYPDARDRDDPDDVYRQIIRLIAKVPTLAAFAFRHNAGQPYTYPNNESNYVGNFLSMLFKMSELRYQPDPRIERALEVLFILHADHEQNCSTTALRVVASSHADPYSAVAAGIAALYGPLHGGANEAVLRMLTRIGSADNVPGYIEQDKSGQERLMGFGHRIYKNYDPRARLIKKAADDVMAARGPHSLLNVATELEKRALGACVRIRFRRSGQNHDALRSLPAGQFPPVYQIQWARIRKSHRRGRRLALPTQAPRRRLLRLPPTLPERGLLLRADLPGARPADGDVPGAVCDPAHQWLDRAVVRDAARSGTEDRASFAGLQGGPGPALPAARVGVSR